MSGSIKFVYIVRYPWAPYYKVMHRLFQKHVWEYKVCLYCEISWAPYYS